jgi:hypothetical protein
MATQTSINPRNYFHDGNDERDSRNHINEYDEEFDETEDDLIENYLYLTQQCGVLRHSSTTSALNTMQQQQQHQHKNQSVLSRQLSLATETRNGDFERSLYSNKHHTSLNDFNNNCQTMNRIPPTIYYDGEEYDDKSFSLVKLFARMKARLKHDRRYRPKSTHELLYEEDTQEWFELTKNTRDILTKVLLPDGGYDALIRHRRTSHHRQGSQKKSREYDRVLSKHIESDKIDFHIDDDFNTEGDEEFDQIISDKFSKCSRGLNYRRCGVCKAVDRQQFQGQLVYIYGVANNILIDENLKASGLG